MMLERLLPPLQKRWDKTLSSFEKSRFWQSYRRLFSIAEIESDLALKWMYGAVILGFYITFYRWISDSGITVQAVNNGTYLCWPFFQSCAKWYFIWGPPASYMQTTIFMGMFGLMALGCYAGYRGRWALAHLCMLVLFSFKMYLTAINYVYHNNWDYYQSFFAITILFFPHKRFFGQLIIVMCYFLSTATKISPAWTMGAYFSSLQNGLALFPYHSEIFFTNLVMFEEMVGAWFLFSSNKILQRCSLIFYIVFHLYSGVYVYYLYPTYILPMVIILFGPLFKPYKQVPLDKKSLVGWSFIAFMVFCQFIPRAIEGNERITLEGNFYSMFMFEANHQCRTQLYTADGRRVLETASPNAQRRCDPYSVWFKFKNRYCTSAESSYHLMLDHSINGSPFYRVVDEPNICTLTYKPFSHNEWIKDHINAPIVGYARKNFYQ